MVGTLQSKPMGPPPWDARRFWLWNAAAWLGIGVAGATRTVFVMRSQGMHHAWSALFVSELLAWVPWALATPLVFAAARRFPPLTRRSPHYLAVHVGICGGIAVAAAAWVAMLERWLNPWLVRTGPPPFRTLWLIRTENGLLETIVLYLGCLALRYSLDVHDHLLRQEAESARISDQLAQARLGALQQQLEPHFLFNALNTVTGLIRDQRSDLAVQAVAALSDCLRRVLRGPEGAFVPLAQELEFVEQYLQLQRLRFGESLDFALDVAADTLQCQVPSLLLQPLVDNAVKHGVAQRVRGGAIRLGVHATGEALTVTVYNDAPTGGRTVAEGLGIGLANLRARLRVLYADASRMTIDRTSIGVTVSVTLPLRR
jgi:two-component system, LytTR family, sensor kinase